MTRRRRAVVMPPGVNKRGLYLGSMGIAKWDGCGGAQIGRSLSVLGW